MASITSPQHPAHRPSGRRATPRRSLDPRTLLDESDRQTRRRVLANALAAGVPLHPDAATVAVAAKRWRPEPFGYFDEEAISELLWVDMLAWCEAAATELPLDAGAALWHLVCVLVDTGAYEHHSEPASDIKRQLKQHGGVPTRLHSASRV